ncbi:MAG: DUF4234 domain-containing protein [Oscillospiraceae bacterium]
MKNRNIALCIVLSIVTCGIYGLYWWACLVDEANIAAGEPGTSGVGVILLSIVTCSIYGVYYDYRIAEKHNKARAMRGLPADNNMGLIYILLSLFQLKIVTFALMQNAENNMTAGQNT